jgi:hypothetical protein
MQFIIAKQIDFFNSTTGLLYKIKSECDTVVLVLERVSTKASLDILNKNIDIIRNQLPSEYEAIKRILSKGLSSKMKMKETLKHASESLYDIVNSQSLELIKENPKVILH